MKKLLSLLLLAGLAFGQVRHIQVISHRGEHLKHPENTLPAYQAAIGLGADYFEVDIRTTSDGKLVMMHDSTADRTTNGKGRIADMTFEQVRALDAGIRTGPHFAGTPVPTFEEVLSAVRGRSNIYVDAKSVSARDLIEHLERFNMLERVVVYAGSTLLRELQRLRPKIRIMPESVNPTVVRTLLADLSPRVIAYSEGDWNEDTIAPAREARVDIFVDRLGAQDTPDHWQDAIDRGATGIQTDRVADLLNFLRAKGLHR